MEPLQKLLEVANRNALENPSIVGVDTKEIAMKYLNGLADEVEEVAAEFKDNNSVHLTDELSDIVWDYFVVLKICETRGWIESTDEVFKHAIEKYEERSPAMIEADETMWDEIKSKQKAELKAKHQEKHGA